MTDEEKKAIANFKYWIDTNTERGVCYLPDYICAKVLNLIEKTLKENEYLHKEIEELKASHITTKNKATNTEKAKIFDVIENSIDTYIEKSKPYWEQIMTKDEMTIEEAETIIDDMYQDKYKIMSQKTEKETIVDLSKMDYIKFTNLEWASVRVLREVQSLRHEMEKQEKEIEELKEKEKNLLIQLKDSEKELLEVCEKLRNSVSKDKIKAKIEEVKDGTYDAKIVLQSLLEKE